MQAKRKLSAAFQGPSQRAGGYNSRCYMYRYVCMAGAGLHAANRIDGSFDHAAAATQRSDHSKQHQQTPTPEAHAQGATLRSVGMQLL